MTIAADQRKRLTKKRAGQPPNEPWARQTKIPVVTQLLGHLFVRMQCGEKEAGDERGNLSFVFANMQMRLRPK